MELILARMERGIGGSEQGGALLAVNLAFSKLESAPATLISVTTELIAARFCRILSGVTLRVASRELNLAPIEPTLARMEPNLAPSQPDSARKELTVAAPEKILPRTELRAARF